MVESQPTSPPLDSDASRPTTPSRRKRKRRPWMLQKNARRRMKQYAREASDLLREALRIAAGLAGDAGVPGLSSGLEALLTILEKIETMRTNIEGVETLKARVGELKDMIQRCLSRPRGQQFEDIQRRIDALCKKLSEAAVKAEGIRARGIIRRFFTSNSDAKRLQGVIEDINTAIQDFVTQTVLNVDENVHFVRQDVKAIRVQQEMSLLSKYAEKAQYNSGDSSNVRRECLKGTRKEVLADAYDWIHKSSEEVASCTAEEKSGHFLWISGWAGTGKTTIACSIAKKYSDDGTLAANFFCSRADAQCRDPKFIFVTIARQLCLYHEPFMKKVVTILRKTPDVVHTSPLDQFKALILQPLRELNGVFPTCVIVIDALDECDNNGLTSVVLDILARHIKELSPFLFVVTSRPEPHITAFFERANEVSLKNSTKPLVLHNVYLESVQGDIGRYLADGFREIRQAFIVEDGWPSNRDVDRLTELSKGLFIFAATVLRFIGDPDSSNPKKRLEALLVASASVMHDLYREILRLAYKSIDTLHETNPSLRRVLGVITLAEEPLSAPALADLLGMSEGDVRNTLSRLRSVLHIPEEGSEDAIRFIHPTFPEFLLDETVQKPEAFRIVPSDHHFTLFTRSLAAMDGLKRNIAEIKQPALFRSEVDGLSDTVKKCIPAHIKYACRFWSIHLLRCGSDMLKHGTYDLLKGFLTSRMLYWLEACGLLGVLDGALVALETTERASQNVGGPFASLTPLLADCHRFLWTYYPCIDVAPLQVYHSALALAPTKSLVRKVYAHELKGSLIVSSGALSTWPPRRDSFAGHDGEAVTAVAFSPSGECFVTGGKDCKLKMWKTSTRTMMQSFDGHAGSITCVAFSLDGVHIASASDDHDIRIWLAISGECVHTLKGHTEQVNHAMYSADGRRLLSATVQGEVKLWDTSNQCCLLTLEKTDNYTWQTGLSPDGGVIARANGTSLSLYEVSSATSETYNFSDRVEVCAFSPDGRFVAAGSNNAIQVWRCADKSVVRSIGVPDLLTSRLVFSRDGNHIGYGSRSGSMLLWQVVSEDPPLVFQGHNSHVWDLSWSPDGLQVASASDDGTVRVCDVSGSPMHVEEPTTPRSHPTPSGPPQFALVRHRGATALLHLPSARVDVTHFSTTTSMPAGAPTLALFVDSVDAWAASQATGHPSGTTPTRPWALITGQRSAHFSTSVDFKHPMCISPNGLLLVYPSPTWGSIIDVCDLRSREPVASLAGHMGNVLSIAFSPDSTLIVTSSTDNSVKVWHATTGSIFHSHREHTDWVRVVAFSSDGRLVASGSDDHTIRVLEVATRCVQRVFDGHRDWVTEVAFTTDDEHVLALDDLKWAYIWDMRTGTRLFEISLRDDSWITSLDFSADGAVILTGGGHQVCLPPSDRPTWPVYVVSVGGWVYAKSPGHTVRLCCLPPEWRTLVAWDGARFHCLDFQRKAVVTLDVSDDPEYVRVWGAGT